MISDPRHFYMEVPHPPGDERQQCHQAPLFTETGTYNNMYLTLTLSLPESNLESIKVVVPVESVDETLVCDHSNESY